MLLLDATTIDVVALNRQVELARVLAVGRIGQHRVNWSRWILEIAVRLYRLTPAYFVMFDPGAFGWSSKPQGIEGKTDMPNIVFVRRAALWLLMMNALAVPANPDAAPIASRSPATKEAAVNARELLEQAPQTEYALNAIKTELGPRRDKLLAMQRELKEHIEQFQRKGESLTDADRDSAHEALDAEIKAFQHTAQEFQDDASSKRDRELDKVRKFITHEIESYAANNGYSQITQYEGEVPHGEMDLTKKIHAILKTKPRQLPASEPSEPN